MNRIEKRFAKLKEAGKKGFIAYIGGGDPDLEHTRLLALGMDRQGVDVLELGVPFSDPLADGLTNQLAAQRGLESGTSPAKLLATIREIRKESAIPIVLYVYYNMLFRLGIDRFVSEAAASGVDGLLVLDLPPEEAAEYEQAMNHHHLAMIYLIAPTTPEDRIATIAPKGQGFIYYVSREGVTGVQSNIAQDIGSRVAQIKKHSDLPVAVGFGVSNAEQAALVASQADAVVVGSAIVNRIADLGRQDGMVDNVCELVGGMVDAVKNLEN